MNTATKLNTPLFIAIKGYKDNSILAQATISAWQVIYTALYNGSSFSETEIQEAKKCIHTYLLHADDAEHEYVEMVQRVLLTRQFLSYNPTKYLPAPSVWLNIDNRVGYPGTERWFQGMQEQRFKEPLYKITYKAFAEAILEMHQYPNAANFHYWRTYFIERHCQGLLNLFLSTIANSNFH